MRRSNRRPIVSVKQQLRPACSAPQHTDHHAGPLMGVPDANRILKRFGNHDRRPFQFVQAFTLSFDLWEERFAVSRAGSPPRSISHLRVKDAENWCLENLTMSISSLGIGRDTPFWLRLVYRPQDLAPVAEEQGERYTLQALIDRLSRRRGEGDLAKSVSGGPFRLP